MRLWKFFLIFTSSPIYNLNQSAFTDETVLIWRGFQHFYLSHTCLHLPPVKCTKGGQRAFDRSKGLFRDKLQLERPVMITQQFEQDNTRSIDLFLWGGKKKKPCDIAHINLSSFVGVIKDYIINQRHLCILWSNTCLPSALFICHWTCKINLTWRG